MTSSTATLATAPKFEQTPRNRRLHTGVYFVVVTSAKTGNHLRLKVTKDEYSTNSSARGGAYCTTWVAEFGTTKVRSETRIGALRALVTKMGNEKGIRFVEEI
jgi:hypothetical protein